MLNEYCIAHRFALCTGEGASEVTLVRGSVDKLMSLYYFFNHSSARCSKLRSVQEALEEPVLSVKEFQSVRWLAFFMQCFRFSISLLGFNCYYFGE